MKTVKEEIANNLLFYRKKSKLTQKELANYIGVKNNTISQWENGTNAIDVEILFNICEVLKVSISDMFGTFSKAALPALAPDEKKLIENYRELNDEGQERLSEISYDMIAGGRYKKPNQSYVGEVFF